MRCGRQKAMVDVPTLFRLWNDETLRTEEVARELQLTTGTLRRVASEYGLTHRVSVPSGEITDAPSSAEDLLSQDSLALSPWVAQRAEMFRREKERRGEPPKLEIGVTTLAVAGPRRRRVGFA